jgi:hypothetical protein
MKVNENYRFQNVRLMLGLAAFLVSAVPIPAVKAEPTTVEMLVHLLQGSPDQETLQKMMDEVVAKYGLPPTEQSRRKVGNVLVAMQREVNVPGFDELVCMRDLSPKVTSDMPTAAALCASGIKALPK